MNHPVVRASLGLVLVLAACPPAPDLRPTEIASQPPNPLPIGSQVLWIGDSLTLQPGFRNRVEASFEHNHPQRKIRFETMAARGATVGWALEQFQVHQPKMDVVIILLGTNDSGSLGFQRSVLRSYLANMNRLIDSVLNTGARPIIVTPPCVASHAYRLQQKNRMLNKMTMDLIQLGKKRSIEVIDLHSMFCQLGTDPKHQPDLFADDKHPSAKGHQAIAQMLLGGLAPILE